MHPCLPRRAAAATNPWGTTPLHHAAASRGAARRVARLLAAGADANAVGPYGSRPLAYALWAGQDDAAALLTQAHGLKAPGPSNEATACSWLATVCGIERPFTTLAGQRVPLAGALESGVYPRLGSLWRDFCRDPGAGAGLVPTQAAAAIAQALEEAFTNTTLPTQALLPRATGGQPVILLGGWRGHSVSYVLWGGYVIRADRRQPPGRSAAVWQVSRFATGARTLRRLAAMQAEHRHSKWRSLILARYHAAPCEAGDAVAAALAATPLKAQHMGNCVVANAKAAVLALLVLLLGAQHHERAYACYKRFATYLRLRALGDYLQAHSQPQAEAFDVNLVHACLNKLCKGHRLPAAWREALLKQYSQVAQTCTD